MTEPGTRAADLELRGITKRFGHLTALAGVDLAAYAGQVLAVVGDNGAGKSTVVQCLAGVLAPTAGRIILEGDPVRFSSPLDARAHGIDVVPQDLALASAQPVYMNVFLGRELVKGPLRLLDRPAMAAQTSTLLEELDVHLESAARPIRDLSGGQRQAVAIARAVHWAQRLVLMDEPTAALGIAETARVEELILRLRERGRGILLVSHSLDQVLRLADRVCVLRRGRQVGVRRTSETSGDELVAMITGLRD
jgi:D-xylose transport system ATP-binding protein